MQKNVPSKRSSCYLCSNMRNLRKSLQRYDFIAENLNLMGISGDTWNCILVTARGVQEGVLVQSDGADYARYASLIPILTEDMIQECSGSEELTEETLHQQIF